MKRRPREFHVRARKEGEGAGEADPGAGRTPAAVLRRWRGGGVEELRGAVRGGEEVLLPLYRAEGEGERARPRRWRGVGGRPAPLMPVGLGARLREGKGRAGAAGSAWRLHGTVEEAEGRGEPGRRDGGTGDRRPRDQGRRGWRLGTAGGRRSVTCGPHTSASEREGERRRGAGGPRGPEAFVGRGVEKETDQRGAGRSGEKKTEKRKEEEVGWAAGRS
jgi:hypothetical protein